MTATDFQARASRSGREYEQMVADVLSRSGWRVTARHETVYGVEIDIVAVDPNGVRKWIECKGSWTGERPGSRRTDSLKKAISDAWVLSMSENRKPYVLVTSHLPSEGSVGRMWLDMAMSHGLIADVMTLGALLPYEVSDDEDDR